VVDWLEAQCIVQTTQTQTKLDTWEQQSFMEGYTQAVWDLETLIRDASKKDIDAIALALKEREEKLENTLE
jgi:hypothetical protein